MAAVIPIPINPPPGVVVTETDRVAEGRWIAFEDQRDKLFIAAYEREGHPPVTDDYQSLDHGLYAVNDVGSRTQVACTAPLHHKHYAVLLGVGQSNIANTIDGRFDPGPHVINFSLYDGKCYLALDPLLGATNVGGNVMTRLAQKLVDSGAYDDVVVAPVAVGGSRVKEWALGGGLNRRLVVAIARLHAVGLEPTHVLWHQGEADAADNSVEYRVPFFSVFSTIRRNGVYAPIYVAQTSVCSGPPVASIRAIQRGLVDADKGIFAGPDTDQIGAEQRPDGCHMSAAGGEAHAELWRQVLDPGPDQ